MDHATETDLKTIEGLLTGSAEGSVTIRMRLAAALVDEIRKRRGHDAKKEASAGTFEVATILSSRTKEGMVNLYVDGNSMQLTLAKAREIHQMIGEAIEVATSDQLIHMFLTQKIGLGDDQANRALLDFRELRQGSRGTVFPS
jgi:hypothetical protein